MGGWRGYFLSCSPPPVCEKLLSLQRKRACWRTEHLISVPESCSHTKARFTSPGNNHVFFLLPGLCSKLFIFRHLLTSAVQTATWTLRRWRDVNKFIFEELLLSSSETKNTFKKADFRSPRFLFAERRHLNYYFNVRPCTDPEAPNISSKTLGHFILCVLLWFIDRFKSGLGYLVIIPLYFMDKVHSWVSSCSLEKLVINTTYISITRTKLKALVLVWYLPFQSCWILISGKHL